MQRKRNIRLLISLAVLVAVACSLLFSFRNEEEVIADKNIFKVPDLTQIDQVVLLKDGKTINLKFDGSRWRVNDQLADRRMIEVLFATLQQAEPKRPVAELMQDSVNKTLTEQGVRVSLSAGGNLQKEFLTGGNPSKTQSYFKNFDEEESFVVVIPGYRVYTSGIFELDENGWRDKYVFNFNWKNFQSLKSLSVNSKNDFEISMGESYFEVKDVAVVDTSKLNSFLDAVSLLTVDRYVDKEEVKSYDSLLGTKPLVELQVSDVSGKIHIITFFETEDNSLYLGIIGGEQPAFFDRRKVAGLFRNKSWFAKG